MDIKEEARASVVLQEQFILASMNFLKKFKPAKDGKISQAAFVAININVSMFIASFVLEMYKEEFFLEQKELLLTHIDQLCSNAKDLVSKLFTKRSKEGLQ